jgi:ABC-type glycerol-3-phosphate transport system permease component
MTSTWISPSAQPSRRKRNLTPGQWVVWALLVVGAIVMIFPVYWMFITAVSPPSQTQETRFYLWPSSLDWSNFTNIWQVQPVGRWFVNSAIIAVLGVVITVAVSLLAGYAFAKFRFPGRDALFVALLVTIMVPIQVIIVPEFIIVTKFGLANSPWAVILPRAAEAVAIFMARQFMLGIPNELIHSARVDGASELAIFRKVILPISRPLISVLVILTFVWRWNDFVWPLVALQGEDQFTLPLGLSSMNNMYQAPWGSMMAVSLLSILPTVIIFVVFQRQFVQGIANTGLK